MTMQRWSGSRPYMSPHETGEWVRFTDAQAAIKAARRKALEDAAKLAERFAAQMADMVLEGLPDKARHREGMEATATRLAAAIRAMMENDDGPR